LSVSNSGLCTQNPQHYTADLLRCTARGLHGCFPHKYTADLLSFSKLHHSHASLVRVPRPLACLCSRGYQPWDLSPDPPSRSGHGGWFLPRPFNVQPEVSTPASFLTPKLKTLPLSSEGGTCKTAKARFWPCFQVKVLKMFQVVASLLDSGGERERGRERGGEREREGERASEGGWG